MAGLLDTKQGAGPQGAGPQGDPNAEGLAPDAAGEEPQANVSKEEQAQYDQFVTNAMSMMNDKQGADALLNAIMAGNNPVQGLANAVAAIVMRVESSAEKAGQKIDGDVLFHGGVEILEQAADLAEQAGAHSFTEEELEQATYLAMDQYREGRGDKLDQKSFAEDLMELKQAEESGTLEEQIPGITSHAQQIASAQVMGGRKGTE